MESIVDDGTRLMREFVPASPFVAHLGIECTDLADGRAELTLPFREELATLGSVVHGGAIATLIDTAAMAASWAGAELPESLRGSTVGLSASYLAPADGRTIRASARVVRRGRRLATVHVDVHDTEGTPVATALVTYQLG